ncbi:F-box/kelch-repeat protein [Prunus yedoensis var. nudiflora]|uniref:F-box/kelch-repeat protein n=1 Tax=Prunus yedoensis var. nudiflora TaxID=2094558 RepID=A0A314XP54_PRUYE|nr:F-box/kelch-repeat protein [Prunus yedoensis var. nudiflora]
MEAKIGDKVTEDIIYEILLRLPVKSLLRFMAVCKSWNCMIKSSTFITHHLIQNEDVQLLLHDPEYGMYSLYKDDDNDDGRASSTLREYTNLDNPYDVYDEGLGWPSKFVGTCKGLVCLAAEDIDFTTLLWNPSIRKFVVLPKSGVTLCHEYDDLQASCGFGYDRRANDYKVLRRVSSFRGNKFISCQYEIWSLAKGSWKTLNTAADPEESDIMLRPRRFFVSNPPAFVNGALHWTQARAHTGNVSLLSFDISDEVFGKIAIPPEASAQTINHLAQGHFMVSRYRESLAYYETSRERKGSVGWGCLLHIHMWVMEEYGVAKSWAKLFAICLDLDLGVSRLIGCRKSGEEVVLRIMDDDGEYRSVNPETKQVKKLRIEGQWYYDYEVMDALTESVVLLDQPNLFTIVDESLQGVTRRRGAAV